MGSRWCRCGSARVAGCSPPAPSGLSGSEAGGNGGINDYLWSATSQPLSFPRAPFITAAGWQCVGENMCTHTHTGMCAEQLLLTCIHWLWAQQSPSIFAHISIFFFPHLKVTYLKGGLLSCRIHHHTHAELETQLDKLFIFSHTALRNLIWHSLLALKTEFRSRDAVLGWKVKNNLQKVEQVLWMRSLLKKHVTKKSTYRGPIHLFFSTWIIEIHPDVMNNYLTCCR